MFIWSSGFVFLGRKGDGGWESVVLPMIATIAITILNLNRIAISKYITISHFHIFWSYDPVLSFHMPYYKIYTQSSILNKQLLASISRDIKFLFWWKIWSNCAQSLKPFLWWLSLTKAKSITHTSEYFQTEQILSGCVLLPKEATFKQIDWVSFYAKMTLKLCKKLHHSRKGFIICELPL